MGKILVIYHANCFDGFTAAWLFHRAFPDAEFYPARYGDKPPDVTGKAVIIVDFCYKRPVMEQIEAQASALRVLDHHKTAEADLDGFKCDELIFDMERSGAMIALDFLKRGIGVDDYPTVKRFVAYIQDRDLWRNALPDTEAVSAWIATQEMTWESWDRLCAQVVSGEAARAGQHVQAYIEQYGRKARAEVREEVFVARPTRRGVPTVNLPYMNCSEHIGALCEENPWASFCAGYFRRGDGRWQFSLRSRGDFDVSEIAQFHGGGGHKNAAGFDVASLSEVFGGKETE